MNKRIVELIVVLMISAGVYGCVAVLGGAAGGAGTSMWLSGKLSQEVNAPFDRTVIAAKSALESMKLEITKETVKKDVAQIMSKYFDGKTIWVDVREVTKATSKVDVRVGAVNGDKEASDKILKEIQRRL